MKHTPEQAELLLSDVEPEHFFVMYMGAHIRNLEELAEAIDISSEENFKHHVNAEKNDFANWIRDCVKDHELYESVKNLKSKTAMVEKIRKRVLDLDKRADMGRPVYSDEWMHFGMKDFIAGAIIGFVLGVLVRYVVMAVLL